MRKEAESVDKIQMELKWKVSLYSEWHCLINQTQPSARLACTHWFGFTDGNINANKRIFYVCDLLKEDGIFLSLEEFCAKYNVDVSFLKCLGCVSSVKSCVRKKGITFESLDHLPEIKAYGLIVKAPKGARTFYDIFTGTAPVLKACQKWETFLETEIEWKRVFELTKKIKEIKLRWFQMKINYRILVTNSILKSMRVLSSDLCNFCLQQRDTIFHYLWDCVHAQAFWKSLVQLLKDKCTNCTRLCLNSSLVLFGHDNKTHTDIGFNHILLSAKFFIYRNRILKTKPKLQQFLQELKHIIDNDKYMFRNEFEYDKYIKKWASYTILVEW